MDGYRVVFVWAVMQGCGDQRDSISTATAARRQSKVVEWFQGHRTYHSDTDVLLSTQ
jgi:hypothetical protein